MKTSDFEIQIKSLTIGYLLINAKQVFWLLKEFYQEKVENWVSFNKLLLIQ